MKKLIWVFLAGFLLAGTPAILSAAEADTGVGDARWVFKANIYGWLPHAPAKFIVNQMVVANLPENLGDILDGLKMASMTEFSLNKGPLSFFVSPLFYNGSASKDFTGPTGQNRTARVKEKVWLVDYGVGWKFGPWKMGEDAASPTITVGPFVGARYFHDPIRLDVAPGVLDQGLNIKTTLAFTTPFAGLRADVKFSDKWSLSIEGDYGVFDTSEIKKTYQALGVVSYHFKIKNTPSQFFVGYRYLRIELEKDPLIVDVEIKGPLLGIGFAW